MSTSLVLIGKLILSEAASRAAEEGIRILDEKLDFHVKSLKRKNRGDQ